MGLRDELPAVLIVCMCTAAPDAEGTRSEPRHGHRRETESGYA